MERLERGKDRQDLEIESIIQVRANKYVEGGERINGKSLIKLGFIHVLQHARELETQRREAEERERKKQREVQMELERQLKEAEVVRESFEDNQQKITSRNAI